jgi:hypothetical protein
MVIGIVVPVAILGLLVVGAAMLFRRGGDGLDFAPRNLLRLYLHIASLAGIIILAIGLSGILNAGLAAALGTGFVYGSNSFPVPAIAQPCPPNIPPGSPECKGIPPDFAERQARELERRRGDDLIRGITFAVFGALFWGAHWAARRSVVGPDEPLSGMRRGYLMLGTVIFGLSTVVLLPMGIYQALSFLILPAADGVYRPGAGESLSGGLVTLPIWIIYLSLVVRELRGQSGNQRYYGGGPTPGAPSGVGAPNHPSPSDFQRGAEAMPPDAPLSHGERR